MMKHVGKLGKVLGPQRQDAQSEVRHGDASTSPQAVTEFKAGKVEFRVDKTAIVHVPFGKLSFEDQQLVDNAEALLDAVVKAKPSAAKGKYLISVHVSSTMGPGVSIDPAALDARA